jgi:RimJ/RimL family protein N-acetyltransferase
MMRSYNCLDGMSSVSADGFSLVPIRVEDKYLTMQWRNEQLYHLRQSAPLTKSDQDLYFETVVNKMFGEDKPAQLLFSYLDCNQVCIGYGGLVHINWDDKNAEVSFIMSTALEKKLFEFHWSTYLSLVRRIAFKAMRFHKIYTYAFDLRPHLYVALEKNGFTREAVLLEHCLHNDKYKDVIIHSLINTE